MKDQHKRQIRLWENYGTLVDPGKGRDSITSVFDHDTFRKVRALWQDAWKARQRCRRIKPEVSDRIKWEDVNSAADLAAYGDTIELALVETVRGIAYLGISDNEDSYSAYCGEVEAVLFPFAEQSEAFGYMMSRSQSRVIPARQSIEQIWKEWFQKLAGRSRDIVIIDRYACTKQNLDGLRQILRFLNEDGSKCGVTVYASHPVTMGQPYLNRSETMRRIENAIATEAGVQREVTVFLVADYRMTRDRYMSLGECAFTIGHGVSEAFKQPYVSQDIPCALDTRADGIIRIIRSEARRHRDRYDDVLRFEQGS